MERREERENEIAAALLKYASKSARPKTAKGGGPASEALADVLRLLRGVRDPAAVAAACAAARVLPGKPRPSL